MRARLLFLFILLIAKNVHGSCVLDIDLNNSKNEVKACAQGVKAASPLGSNGKPKDCVYVINKDTIAALQNYSLGYRVDPYRATTPADLDSKIRLLKDSGTNVNAVYVAGHDANGNGFNFQYDPNGAAFDTQIGNFIRKLRERNYTIDGITMSGQNAQGQSSDIAYEPPPWEINAYDVSAYLSELEHDNPKLDIDTLMMSGHDGNGVYFGENGGISSKDLKWILDRPEHKQTHDSIKMMIQWGCYTGNANACENIWGHHISSNIKTMIGFTVQSPDHNQPGNPVLLKDVCGKRKAMQNAVTSEEYDSIFKSLDGVNQWNVGICHDSNGGGVCSPDYDQKDAQGNALPNQTCDHSYAELQRRCAEFDPGGAGHDLFQSYLEGSPGFEDVPNDDDTTKSPLRNYYSQLHLWRHCAASKINPKGMTMDSPSKLIRLIRFGDIKNNLLKFHRKQLDEYNNTLAALHLDQDQLVGVEKMSRADIVTKTKDAISKIEGMKGSRLPNGINWVAADVMAQSFDRTLRVLDPSCVPMSWVHANMGQFASPCIANYGERPAWPK